MRRTGSPRGMPWTDDEQANACAGGGMKLRIKGSSLRLRLTQGEVHSLETAGEVAEQVHFGGGARLTYRLRMDGKSGDISASYGDNVIDIRVPRETALTWAHTDQVTLSHAEAV